MDDLVAPLVVGIVFWTVYRIFELFVRRNERMKLIDHISEIPDVNMINERLFPKEHRVGHKTAIKIASLVIGIALGMFIGIVLMEAFRAMTSLEHSYRYDVYECTVGASTLFFGGLGLLIPSLYFYRQEKKEK